MPAGIARDCPSQGGYIPEHENCVFLVCYCMMRAMREMA